MNKGQFPYRHHSNTDNKSSSLLTALFMLILIVAGVSLGVFLMNINLTTNDTEESFWNGVETEESDYVQVTVSVSDTVSLISRTDTVSDGDSSTAEPIKMWTVANVSALKKLMKSEYKKAHKINPDVIGWIYFPCSTRKSAYINEPLFDDRTRFYLHNNIYGQNGGGGQIFIDPKTEPWEDSLLIHGHNMIAETHLGKLKYLTNQQDFMENRMIYVYVAEEDSVRIYVTFSCLLFSKKNYVPHQYIYSDKTERDFIEYADLLHSLSMYDCEYEYSHILSFHTCNRTYKGAHILVSAYQIDKSQYILSTEPIEELQKQLRK